MFFLIKLAAFIALAFVVMFAGSAAWIILSDLPSPVCWLLGLPLVVLAWLGAKLCFQARL